MAILKLNSTIVDNETKVWMAWDGFEGISFEDVKKFISEIPEDDTNIDLQINCAGGDCIEGWAIYDALRQSGKVITAIIEGQCSSMASVILLAAPKENRKAFANAHLCIHNPEACWLNVDYYTRLTADNIDAMTDAMQKQAQSLREEQQKILNLYVERTGTAAGTLQALMNDDIYVGMTKAKELGFISETLAPNTASKKSFFNSLIKPQQMAKSTDNKSAIAKAFAALGVALGITEGAGTKMQSLTLTTTTGDELVVEREDGDPQVGDAASPDGTFVLDDGTTIVVENGVITSITKDEGNNGSKAVITNPLTGEELTEEQAQQLINDLTAKIAELEEKLAEADRDKATKDAQIASLQSNQISAEQNEILATVASKGGKEWLTAVAAAGQANGFQKQNPQQALGGGETRVKIGAGFLKAHTAMRFGKAAVED